MPRHSSYLPGANTPLPHPNILAQAQEFEGQKLSKFHFLILVLRPENMGTQPVCRGWGTKEVMDEIRDKRATTQSHWTSWVTCRWLSGRASDVAESSVGYADNLGKGPQEETNLCSEPSIWHDGAQ